MKNEILGHNIDYLYSWFEKGYIGNYGFSEEEIKEAFINAMNQPEISTSKLGIASIKTDEMKIAALFTDVFVETTDNIKTRYEIISNEKKTIRFNNSFKECILIRKPTSTSSLKMLLKKYVFISLIKARKPNLADFDMTIYTDIPYNKCFVYFNSPGCKIASCAIAEDLLNDNAANVFLLNATIASTHLNPKFAQELMLSDDLMDLCKAVNKNFIIEDI